MPRRLFGGGDDAGVEDVDGLDGVDVAGGFEIGGGDEVGGGVAVGEGFVVLVEGDPDFLVADVRGWRSARAKAAE